MKKVYIPTQDEMYQMQSVINSDNMYKYLMIKTAEVLIAEGINYPAKGILNPNCMPKYIMENEELTRIIARLYPEVIPNCQSLITSPGLCLDLIRTTPDRDVESLDNLSYFDSFVNYSPTVIKETLIRLKNGLLSNPKYRFTYKKSPLLESIFGLETEAFMHQINDNIMASSLLSIDPTYLTRMTGATISKTESEFKQLVNISLEEYFKRYGLEAIEPSIKPQGDILTNPTLEVKRLIKTMNKDKLLKY